MQYPVIEHFHSFQGEGEHMGKSAFFIRLAGCPVRCAWCDSAETWRGNAIGEAEKFSAEKLAELAGTANPEIVVITGGEPTIHDLQPLVDALHAKNLSVHLETCGAFRVPANIDWITLSPKPTFPPLPENWSRADEIKFIITSEEDLAKIFENFRDFSSIFDEKNRVPANRVPAKLPTLWLHPEWSRSRDAALLVAIVDFVRSRGKPWRAGWQLHKLYHVK